MRKPSGSKVTFTPEQLQSRLPEGYRLLEGKHPSVGKGSSKRLVPFYVNLRNLNPDMIRERFGLHSLSKILDAPVFRIDAPKGSVARSASIRKIEMWPRQFNRAISNNETLVPFAAAKAKDGAIVLRALNGDISGPQAIDWNHISRGKDNQADMPDKFNFHIDREMSSLPRGSKVLIIGAGFGKSVLEFQKAHRQIDVLGLDIHDWAHALKVLDDRKLRRSAAYIRRRIVLANASPSSKATPGTGQKANYLPFKDKSIDLVVMHPCTFMYLKNPLHSLRDIFRITKDSGLILGDFAGSDIEYYRDDELCANQLSLPDVLRGHFGAKVDVLAEGKNTLFLSMRPGNHLVSLPEVKSDPNNWVSVFAADGKLPGGSQIFKNWPGKSK